jgi:hypothetical protein
MLVEEL